MSLYVIIHIMHDQNDYCFSKMIIKIQEILHYTKFWDNAMPNQKWGKLKMKLEGLPIVITVFRSTWMTTKINRVATDLFCTSVIGHPGHVFLS